MNERRRKLLVLPVTFFYKPPIKEAVRCTSRTLAPAILASGLIRFRSAGNDGAGVTLGFGNPEAPSANL